MFYDINKSYNYKIIINYFEKSSDTILTRIIM